MTDSSHLQLYVDESKEKLTELNNALLTLEDDGDDDEALDMSFRSAHTIKGNSKAMGFEEVGDLAHAVEDLLDEMRAGEIPVTSEAMDLAFEGLDEIEAAMSEIETDGDVQRDPEPAMREIRDGLEGLLEETGDGGDEDEAADVEGGGAATDDEVEDDAAVSDGGAADGTADDEAGSDAATGDGTGAAPGDPEPYALEVEIDTGPIPGADALLVLEAVEQTAPILETRPSRERVEGGDYDQGFDVIVETGAPDELADELRGKRNVTAVAVTSVDPASIDASLADEASDSAAGDADGVDSADASAVADDAGVPAEPADETGDALAEGAEETGDEPIDDAAGESAGVWTRLARGTRATYGATVAAFRSLPGVAGGSVASEASGAVAGASASDGDDAVDAETAADDGTDGVDAEPDSTDADSDGVGDSDATADASGADAVAGATDDAGNEAEVVDETDTDETTAAGDAGDGSAADAADGTAADEDTDDAAEGGRSSSASSSGVSSVRIDVSRLDELYGIVEQLYTNRIRLRRIVEAAGVDEASEQLDALDKNTTQLQDAVMDMRLVPLSRVLDRFPRTVRDIARDQGKEIDLQIEGDDVEVDRIVLDEISDPLMHLVRNAVDHGLETPAEREAAGKEPEGSLAVRGRRERDQVVIEVEDDGRGLDADDLRDKAVDEGVHTREEVEAMDDGEVHELIFHSGFSTAEEVTDVSGRGVGMDVVRQRVTELDGTVSIDSALGEGTTVTLRLPVTVAIVEVLFVDVGSATYGIPIKEIDRVSRDEGIQTVNGEPSIEYEDTIYPVIDLNEFFGEQLPAEDADRRLVRIHPDRRQIAILCDAVHDHEEVVVKPLAGPVANTPGLSGTTVLGDGDVVPIVDVQSISG